MTGKRLLATYVFIFIAALGISAQSSNFKGVVNDANGRPIAGATVVLRNDRTGLERVATTDTQGRFSFTKLSSDSFTLITTAGGFARNSAEVAAGTEELSVSLQPAQVKEEVIVISGSRQEELRESLNTKVDVITREDIRTTGYETVAESLREVPGVVTRRGSETSNAVGEQVQGIDSRQVLVLLDGQPVVGARGIKSGILNLDRQSTSRLESIEVVKGASSALYGSDAIGGVINLRTREQTSPFNASAAIGGGSQSAFDVRGQTGFKANKLSGLFSLERHKNNGFDLFERDFTRDGSGFHRYDAYGKIKYEFTDNFSVIGFVNSYWNDMIGQVQAEPSPLNPSGLQTSNIKDESHNYGLTADWAIDGKTNLQIRGYFSRFDEINQGWTQAGVRLPDGNLFERYGKFDFTVSRIIGERHFLQAGAEFATNRYSGLNRLMEDKGKADTQVFWLQDKISLTNRFTLTIGGRYDHHSIFGSAVSPKIGLNYRLADWASLRASWGRGFRAPDLGQLRYQFSNVLHGYQVLGNPNLSPEHSGSWQIGGEFNALSRRLRFGVNYFRNDVRNLINSQNLGMVTAANIDSIFSRWQIDPALRPFVALNRLFFIYRNTANVYTQGLEFDMSYKLPYGFGFSGAYTYMDAIDKNPTVANRYLTGRYKHHGFTKLSYLNTEYGFEANLRGSYFSSWWATASRKSPAYQLFDLYGSKKLWKGFDVFATIDNLFNDKDPRTGLPSLTNPNSPLGVDRAEVGRTFRVGLRWEFQRGK